ncbi:MAG: DUF2442 domain-containing protein [Bacteroidota bacterium]|jgi:hypothetical protein|nr:DUF2442 domain-containing protein [Bacteroidota bacterium]
MIATHNIEKVSFENNFMTLQIDGKIIVLNLEQLSPKLAHANKIERELFKISPSGYGMHWPLLDEDLSIEAILKNNYY